MASLVTNTQWGTTIISNSEAQTDITAIFTNTFSTTPNLSPAGPTGAFIQELTDMYINVNSTIAYVCSNVYSLTNAQGIFLDGLGNLFGFPRSSATYTTVNITVTGISGTIIPTGSLVSDGTNNYFFTTDYGITGGTNIVTVQAVNVGNIIAIPNTINTIITPVAGWGSVNNPTAGITGTNIQNDTAYRYTFAYSQAINGRGLEQSLYAIFLNFMNQYGATNYTDTNGNTYPYIWGFYVFVNRTNAPYPVITTESVSVPVGGVYITLYAPNYLDSTSANYNENLQYIAGLILNQIGANQTVNIATISGSRQFNVTYNNPDYPQIKPVTVYFDSPAPIDIYFNFTIKAYNTSISSTIIINNIKNAIFNQFYFGYQTYPPMTMGNLISASDYILNIINSAGAPISVTAQSVNIFGGSTGASVDVPLNQIATLNMSNITVTVL
jgi:hypothetical protein